MFKAVEAKQVKKLRDGLRGLFLAGSKKVLERRLTFPGTAGPFDDKILWRADVSVWGHISAQPATSNTGAQRWLCWFGTDPGADGALLTPSVEINLSLDPGYRKGAGRALVDDDGHFYLGHKGGLGGGRGGQMPMKEFAERIKGFVLEPVMHEDEREEMLFVIGAIDAPDFLKRLHAFVSECERLRDFARRRSRGEETDIEQSDDDSEDDNTGFTPENGAAGTGRRHTGEYDIDRLHGRVVNALKERLFSRGISAANSRLQRMQPDLYVPGARGRMAVLFEVKVSSDTQSWFTALGQLVVYGAGQKPKRVLVAPAPLKHPAFAKAMQELEVSLVTFEMDDDDGIVFDGLDALGLSP